MAKRITQDEFEKEISVPGRLTLIEFYSDSCIPCKRLSPLLAELEKKYPALFIGKVNVAYEKELTPAQGVTSTPTLIFYKEGRELERRCGAVKKAQLEEILTRYQ